VVQSFLRLSESVGSLERSPTALKSLDRPVHLPVAGISAQIPMNSESFYNLTAFLRLFRGYFSPKSVYSLPQSSNNPSSPIQQSQNDLFPGKQAESCSLQGLSAPKWQRLTICRSGSCGKAGKVLDGRHSALPVSAFECCGGSRPFTSLSSTQV